MSSAIELAHISRDELSLLLYLETQAVDYGGALESARMSNADFQIATRWHEEKFIQFERIPRAKIKTHNGIARDHRVVLSDEAWTLAHAERRARCARMMAREEGGTDAQ